MHRTGPDILALAADMPEPATEDATVEAPEPEAEPEEAGSEFEEAAAEPPAAPAAAPVPSTKLGWAASLKALEDAGQGELAAHAKRIQADATRKAQEASQLRAEAEAMLAEARALKASPPASSAPGPIDPWDADALRAMAQREARAMLEVELAPMRAAREAEAKVQATARKEAELDSWIDAHPDFASDETMQAEVAELIQGTQAKGRFIHLDDAYMVISARRQAGEQARLQAEAKARAAAKVAAVSKTQAGAKGTGVAAAPRKPASHLSAQEILALAKQG
jgi:translation initiation factor 5B